MAASARVVDERLDLVDGLIYADVFDCALGLEELWRYARRAIDPETLEQRMREDPALDRVVVERDGLYCFADRPYLIDRRPARIRRAHRLERRARRLARVLRHVPFVRAVALTGSVAADHAAAGADVDLMLIVAPGRLATVFLPLGSISRLSKRRLLCPNLYVSERCLEMPQTSLYAARELAQARILAGDQAMLRVSNPWLTEVFPNAVPARTEDRRARRTYLPQRLVEALLRGGLGERLEHAARRVALSRLRIHYRGRGENVPAEVIASFQAGATLRFHGGQIEQRTLASYAARRAEIAARLESFDRQQESARRTVAR